MDYIGDELELFKNASNWKRYFSTKLKPYVKGSVLDVGAGMGTNYTYLVNPGVNLWHFLEPDPKLCSRISENIKPIEGVSTRVTNGTTADLTDEKYDTIIYIDVLEHIEAPMVELTQAAKLLKSTGHLIILVPAYNVLYSDFDKAIGHFKRYNKRTLKADVPPAFKIEKLFYLDSFGVMASIANKLFLKQQYPTLKQVELWDKKIVPLSRILDPLLLNSAGKSLIGIFKHADNE